MKKRTSFSAKGQTADIGDLAIYRILPNRYADAVGPFVFLDHIAPQLQLSAIDSGTGAHPHRGIATLTYILEGEDEHFDSAGHSATVHSGGIQWMKAGNGILHDETLNSDSETQNKHIHAFQFWIDLPGKNKAERPEYLAIQSAEVPQKILQNQQGWIKVIAGNYEELSSKIPQYSNQFLYHVHLEAGKALTLNFAQNVEIGAFLPTQNARVNGIEFASGEFIEFDRDAGEIELENHSAEAIDILIFGGESYTEPIVAEGPFIMNDQAGISEAYRDFYNGKYGRITY